MALTVPVELNSPTARLASCGNWADTSRRTRAASISASPSCIFIPSHRRAPERGELVALLGQVGRGGPDHQAVHAAAGLLRHVVGGHVDRSPAGDFQRAGIAARV